MTTGVPGPDDFVGVWGNSPTAWRGRKIAARTGARLVTVEDAFLRSVLPGRAKDRIARRGPIGLIIDPVGLHFDPGQPSLIEELATTPEAQAAAEQSAKSIAFLRDADLSKYNCHWQDTDLPRGYVLVVDQTQGDASLMGADRATFLRMLTAARDEHPGRQIVVRTHPETAAGLRAGHLGAADLRAGDSICADAVSPWQLLAGAHAVYVVSSQLGYEAMLAGHRPRLFGQPFYAGWGLSDDDRALRRPRPAISLVQLFAASHLLAPTWYDPCLDGLIDLTGAARQLQAEARAWRDDRTGHVAFGMRMWKRPSIARFFSNGAGVRFTRDPTKATMAWANRSEASPQAPRVEDGFLRSRGLGAELTPPLSLVLDDVGIYYDPTRESGLERLIERGTPTGGIDRAEALIRDIRQLGLTKYNLSGEQPRISPDGRRVILVPGQVEDDASIRLGAGVERTNLALLKRVRVMNPGARILYKPHPDVLAGLRTGAVAADDLADLRAENIGFTDTAALIDVVDEVWTITSTLGFEAVLRGKSVTTLGAPFYAGWGLTRDLGPVPARRIARPSLEAFVHAALIAYPRYADPITSLPCPVETALVRLSNLSIAKPRPLRMLTKIQGAFAGWSGIWRG
ncbi:MAG: beta-3-deoxy-D-manno-oct-2-ulosonic acid transferase [Paracoccus denitrificans]|nr:MAG: beta-3-deoxy-D-manno-oct-2-ulosonic acid transferase [Paracoccus denitrificans]PZO84816.1 MAG: beta-3-deoxy-D-manno-oct-2-ulosonic acid transferase [Paracoccus denitrificans]